MTTPGPTKPAALDPDPVIVKERKTAPNGDRHGAPSRDRHR